MQRLTIKKNCHRFIRAALSFLNVDDSVTFFPFRTSAARKEAFLISPATFSFVTPTAQKQELLNDFASKYHVMQNSQDGVRWEKHLLREKLHLTDNVNA